jgi:hypothetical protein
MSDMDIGRFAALASETPDPTVETVEGDQYKIVDTPNTDTNKGNTDTNKGKIEMKEELLNEVVGVAKKFAKERTYIRDPSEAPEGADVEEGPQGGYYYEEAISPDGGSSPNPEDGETEGERLQTALNEQGVSEEDQQQLLEELQEVADEGFDPTSILQPLLQMGYDYETANSVTEVVFGKDFSKRTYVSNPSDAPPGVDLHEGPQGGTYYEEEGSNSPSEDSREEGRPQEEKPEEEAESNGREENREVKIAEPEDFASTVSNFIEEEPEMGAFLTAHTPEELEDHTLITTDGGGAGVSVSPDGDIQNLFNHTGPKGIGEELLDKAIAEGGRTLDCYNGYLRKLYKDHGFKEGGRMEFNPDYAPDGWNFEEYETPDVVFMYYDPEEEYTVSDQYYEPDQWGDAKEDARGRADFGRNEGGRERRMGGGERGDDSKSSSSRRRSVAGDEIKEKIAKSVTVSSLTTKQEDWLDSYAAEFPLYKSDWQDDTPDRVSVKWGGIPVGFAEIRGEDLFTGYNGKNQLLERLLRAMSTRKWAEDEGNEYDSGILSIEEHAEIGSEERMEELVLVLADLPGVTVERGVPSEKSKIMLDTQQLLQRH